MWHNAVMRDLTHHPIVGHIVRLALSAIDRRLSRPVAASLATP